MPGRTGDRSARLTLAGVLAVALAFVHQFPVLSQDRCAGHRPDNLAAMSTDAARELRPGDPVLFLPSHARSTALAYPAGFRGTRDVALAAGAPASGTLYGREVDPRRLRRRLAGLDRVWVIADRRVVRTPWSPRDPTERAKLAGVRDRFTLRAESVRDGVILRLYVRRTLAAGAVGATGGPAPPARPRPERW